MALETAISLFETIFLKTAFAGQFWLMQWTIILASLLIITRKTSEWRTLLLPIMVGWRYFGMNMNWMFYTLASILFVVDGLSLKMLESALTSAVNEFRYIRQRGGLRGTYREGSLKKQKERMDIKEQMRELGEITKSDSIKEYTMNKKDKERMFERAKQVEDKVIKSRTFELLEMQKKGIEIKPRDLLDEEILKGIGKFKFRPKEE